MRDEEDCAGGQWQGLDHAGKHRLSTCTTFASHVVSDLVRELTRRERTATKERLVSENELEEAAKIVIDEEKLNEGEEPRDVEDGDENVDDDEDESDEQPSCDEEWEFVLVRQQPQRAIAVLPQRIKRVEGNAKAQVPRPRLKRSKAGLGHRSSGEYCLHPYANDTNNVQVPNHPRQRASHRLALPTCIPTTASRQHLRPALRRALVWSSPNQSQPRPPLRRSLLHSTAPRVSRATLLAKSLRWLG